MIKKYKKEENVSYALGATLVMELLSRRPQSARAIYVSPKADVSAVIKAAGDAGVPVIESEKAFNILNAKGNCFVIGVFDKFVSPVKEGRHHIVLVSPSDSGNLGTIMREVAAFDCADLVIIKPAVDPFDPKTVRASMGAIFNISFSEFESFEAYAVAHGGREIMPFMLGGAPFCDVKFAKGKNYSLVFGNEATGLPHEFNKYGAVMIEQSQKVDSLNLSVASAIALYKLYTVS